MLKSFWHAVQFSTEFQRISLLAGRDTGLYCSTLPGVSRVTSDRRPGQPVLAVTLAGSAGPGQGQDQVQDLGQNLGPREIGDFFAQVSDILLLASTVNCCLVVRAQARAGTRVISLMSYWRDGGTCTGGHMTPGQPGLNT